MKKISLLPLLLFALSCATKPAPKQTILFFCPAGGAKSVIAASYFNRLAEERSLPWVGVALAAEKPYDAVPPPVAEFLARDGFDVREFKPRRAEAAELRSASKVIAIDCEVPAANVERWSDVPKLSADFDGSVAAIRRHVEELASGLPR